MTDRETIPTTQILATCPCCYREDCKISPKYLQATRQEPAKYLGSQGYCPTCDMSFTVTFGQMLLVES